MLIRRRNGPCLGPRPAPAPRRFRFTLLRGYAALNTMANYESSVLSHALLNMAGVVGISATLTPMYVTRWLRTHSAGTLQRYQWLNVGTRRF